MLIDAEVAGESPTLAGLPGALRADVIVLASDSWADELAELGPDGPDHAMGLGSLAPSPQPGVVLLARDQRASTALAAAGLPGWAQLSPDAGLEQLRAAVQAVAQGLVAVPHEHWPAAREPLQLAAGDGQAEPLTAREQEVLELVAEGLSNKLIARRLQISEHTVKFHVSSVYAKLGAASRTEAVSHAARRGLITL